MIGPLTGEGEGEVKKSIAIFTYKNVWKSDRRREPEKFKILKKIKFLNFVNIKNYPRDMLNNFCFHVYT